MASPDSCVDIAVLVPPEALASFNEGEQHERAASFLASDPACMDLASSVPWSAIDLDFFSGEFAPTEHTWTSGPDGYELEIGNRLAWIHPMLLRGPRFKSVQTRHLPYYDEDLRYSRLTSTIAFAANNLDHIVPFAKRGLLFQALKRLCHALEEYLQALFIHRRIYPIAYDKWIREQIVDILDEPAIYDELACILALPSLTLTALRERALRLRALLDQLI
jgi:hypothetical protein